MVCFGEVAGVEVDGTGLVFGILEGVEVDEMSSSGAGRFLDGDTIMISTIDMLYEVVQNMVVVEHTKWLDEESAMTRTLGHARTREREERSWRWIKY